MNRDPLTNGFAATILFMIFLFLLARWVVDVERMVFQVTSDDFRSLQPVRVIPRWLLFFALGDITQQPRQTQVLLAAPTTMTTTGPVQVEDVEKTTH